MEKIVIGSYYIPGSLKLSMMLGITLFNNIVFRIQFLIVLINSLIKEISNLMVENHSISIAL